MLRRRMLQAGTVIAMVAASLLGFSTAASASPTRFTAKAVHANGAGALGVEITGVLTWYNRSVGLTSVKVYANAWECGEFKMTGYQGSSQVAVAYGVDYCAGATGRWFSVDNVVLDGSNLSGGITEVVIDVHDTHHDVRGFSDCLRTASSCYQRP
ncbi:MAG TPA: hypothetical protein VL738_09870 [Dactylosporangium sp.]|nr:hypothetical protein [Dactylosporangium sp.]